MEKEFTFKGQHTDEKVIEVVNSHPYVVYPAGFRMMLMLVAAVGLLLFPPHIATWSVTLAIAITVFAVLYFINAYYSFKESLFIVTNQRLVAITQKGFFAKKTVETDIRNIIDISSEMHGFFKTMLCYGDLIIRTAGAKEKGDIIVENIPDPQYIQDKISSMRPQIQEEIVT
ncbi:MAG: PH domain-containing protein [Candidatus Berkelbacteria bacterium]